MFSRTAPGGRQVRAYHVPVPCGTSIRVEVTKNGRWRNEGLVPIPSGYRQQAVSLVLYAPLDGVVIAYVPDPSVTVSWKDGSDTLDAMKPIGGWVVDVAAHPPASLPDNGGVGELVLAGPNGPGPAVPVHSVVPPPRPDGC